MSLPIPDGPDPSTTLPTGTGINVGFPPSPIGFPLCGFPIPGFEFNLQIPGIPPLPFEFPPQWFFALALKCDLSDPIALDAGLGERGGTLGLDQDPEDD